MLNNMTVTKRIRTFFALHMLMFIETHCDANDIERRVVDGQFVTIKRFPHVVLLKVVMNDGGANLCGGSILNQFLLVTAAHCMDEVDLARNKIWAFVGNENINEVKVVRSVKKTYIHEDYDQSRHAPNNDIAILLLKKALPLNSNIQRIVINIQYPEVTEGYLAGWGVVDEQSEKETLWLQSVSQELQDPHVCSQLLSSKIPGTFCAGSKANSQPRPSSGDSGSGLITIHRELMGVMSLKPVKFPSIAYYTNVTHFYNWVIKKSMEALQYTCRKTLKQKK